MSWQFQWFSLWLQGGWVDIAFENAMDGQMTEEDYPYEGKVISIITLMRERYRDHFKLSLKWWHYWQILLQTSKECRFDSDGAVASITGFETMFYNPDVTWVKSVIMKMMTIVLSTFDFRIPENEKALEKALHKVITSIKGTLFPQSWANV